MLVDGATAELTTSNIGLFQGIGIWGVWHPSFSSDFNLILSFFKKGVVPDGHAG